MVIHAVAIVSACIATLIAIVTWGSIYPPLDWITASAYAPALRVLIALSLSVGIPYFLLAATGPLLQYWYGVSSERTHASHEDNSESTAPRRSPYSLYAISNTGSLLALISYPTLIEPYLSLPREEYLWSILFFLYALLLVTVTVSIRRIPSQIHASTRQVGSLSRKAEWIAFAALPAFLLVATTTVLTQLISPMPLLWIIPLALYLLTFIFAFSGMGQSIFMPLFVFIAAAAAYMYTPAAPQQIVSEVLSYLSLLFFACLFCHARLYALRPHTGALPFFYLCTSLGGMIGTICASLIAPLLFADFFEFPLGLAIIATLAVIFIPSDFFPRIVPERIIRMIRIIAPFFFAVLLTNVVLAGAASEVLASRNFYGAVQLHFTDEATVLMNGTTMHGLQPTAREWSFVPTSYYTQGSGVARAIRYAHETNKNGIRVGVIGLGTGSLAAYCEKRDTFAFYEIDPRIEHIARTYFSYLSRCAGSTVHIGDGRIVLQKEDASSTAYDVLAVDAFTDDAIPAHLLTKEAVELYMSKLASRDGIIAMHTSNRFLELYPVLLSIAREEKLTAMIVNDNGQGGHMGSASQWVLLSKNPHVFDDPAFIGVQRWTAPNPLPRAWSDTYTSLFSVLQVPLPF